MARRPSAQQGHELLADRLCVDDERSQRADRASVAARERTDQQVLDPDLPTREVGTEAAFDVVVAC